PSANLHDTLDDNNPPPPSVPEPLDLKVPARSGPVGSPRVDPTAVTAPPDAPAAPLAGNPCPSCGNEVPPGFLFCGACGARVGTVPAPPAIKPVPGADGRARHLTPGQTPARVAGPQPRGKLVLIRSDGSEGGTHAVVDGVNALGRGLGPLFDGDAFLSPRHAEIEFSGGPGTSPVVRDLRSL